MLIFTHQTSNIYKYWNLEFLEKFSTLKIDNSASDFAFKDFILKLMVRLAELEIVFIITRKIGHLLTITRRLVKMNLMFNMIYFSCNVLLSTISIRQWCYGARVTSRRGPGSRIKDMRQRFLFLIPCFLRKSRYNPESSLKLHTTNGSCSIRLQN